MAPRVRRIIRYNTTMTNFRTRVYTNVAFDGRDTRKRLTELMSVEPFIIWCAGSVKESFKKRENCCYFLPFFKTNSHICMLRISPLRTKFPRLFCKLNKNIFRTEHLSLFFPTSMQMALFELYLQSSIELTKAHLSSLRRKLCFRYTNLFGLKNSVNYFRRYRKILPT